MSTHNICFRREIRKIICGYPLLSVAMESGAKLIMSEILCMSSLSASLMKIGSKIKSLLSGQHFPHYMPMDKYG